MLILTLCGMLVSRCSAGWLTFSDAIASHWLGSHVNIKGHTIPSAWRSWKSPGSEFTYAGSVSTWKLVKYSSSLPIWPLCACRLSSRGEEKWRWRQKEAGALCSCPFTSILPPPHLAVGAERAQWTESDAGPGVCRGDGGEDSPVWVLTHHAARHRGACPALPYITSLF